MLTPDVGELAKEWMKEVLGEGIIPSFEHNIESDAESVLKWSRSNLAAGHVHDVPNSMSQEIKSSEAAVSGFLFPAFLTKGTGSTSPLFEGERVQPKFQLRSDVERILQNRNSGAGFSRWKRAAIASQFHRSIPACP